MTLSVILAAKDRCVDGVFAQPAGQPGTDGIPRKPLCNVLYIRNMV